MIMWVMSDTAIPRAYQMVARELGEAVPEGRPTVMPPGTADSAAETDLLATATSPTSASGGLQRARGLSLVEGQPGSAQGRQVAILAADGVAAALAPFLDGGPAMVGPVDAGSCRRPDALGQAGEQARRT